MLKSSIQYHQQGFDASKEKGKMKKRGLQALALIVVAACGGKQRVYEPPVIAIDPPARSVEVGLPGSEGSEWRYDICIGNQSSGSALLISNMKIEEEPCPGEKKTERFSLVLPEGAKFPLEVVSQGTKESCPYPQALPVTVTYKEPEERCAQRAVLHIYSNTLDADQRDLQVEFIVTVPTPHLVVSPEVLDFGMVEEGKSDESSLTVRNTGLAKLTITDVQFRTLEGPAGFAFKWPPEDGQWIPIEQKTGVVGESAGGEPLVIGPNSEVEIPVRYGAVSDEPAKALLKFLSNDPLWPKGDGPEAKLQANVSGPCLRATPKEVDFGTVAKGSFHAITVDLFGCGDQSVQVYSITLSAGANSPFKLDIDKVPSQEAPLTIKPGEHKSFSVTYLPVTVKKASDGTILADEDTIVIANSSPRPQISIPVKGLAVEGEKPICDFKMKSKKTGQFVEDDGSVLVLDTIEFFDQSYDVTPGGQIIAWEWSVAAPPGSASVFYPSYTFKNPTFEVNVVGEYLFTLKAFNTLMIACDPVSKLVRVKAGEGLVVELTWDTPNDPDQTDECGSQLNCGADMDLHVTHPYAAGPDLDKDGEPDGYFDKKWDCFWFNPRPIWVPEGDPVLDQPRLDRDDTDGAGPENFHYDRPEKDRCYKVGIHYYDDHGFGPSYPTVRIFWNGDKKYEKKGPKMKMLDMWEVGKVCPWSSNFFTEFQGAGGSPYKVIPNYMDPNFNLNPN